MSTHKTVSNDAISVGGRLLEFAEAWVHSTTDQWVLRTVKHGCVIDLVATPPDFLFLTPVPKVRSKRLLMDQSIQHLLDIHAIELVPLMELCVGVFSLLFLVPKRKKKKEKKRKEKRKGKKKKRRLLARDSGFEKTESVCAKTHISNGVFKDNKGSRTPGQLLVLDRPFRGVLTCTDSSCLSPIPEVYLQSETIPVQGSTLQVVLSSSRIHQTHGGGDSLHALAGDPCLPVSGRLACEISVLPSNLQGHRSGRPDTRGSRVCHQPYQEPPKPILCTPASGRCFRHEIGHSFSPNGLTTEDCLTHQAMAVQEMGFPHVSGSTHGLSDRLPRMHALGQVAFETTSMVLASFSGSHYGKEADKTSLTTEGQEFSPLVTVAGDRKVNTSGNSPEDRGDDRRQPLWLGGPLPGTSCAGVVGSEGFGEQYQLARVEGNSISSSAVP
ncbi:uncharacterized protein LOC128345715 [Hemicordylus capensis]|uniref:uncharacterized protein LOC128345715 n=1 Tax=Hemicordylus capensis TaxID=884348 RepID=UPI002304A510|nr:uncharacterized protein LOC128345715 [Hemicordylus capensis]